MPGVIIKTLILGIMTGVAIIGGLITVWLVFKILDEILLPQVVG